MALTSTGIRGAREIFSKIAKESSKFADVNEVIQFMNSNAEFSNFISGTNFGKENYEKWQKLLNIVSSELHQTMLNLNSATNLFLERQEQYNGYEFFNSSTNTSTIPETFHVEGFDKKLY